MRWSSLDTARWSSRAWSTAGKPRVPTRTFSTSADVATIRRMVTNRWADGTRGVDWRTVGLAFLITLAEYRKATKSTSASCDKVVSHFRSEVQELYRPNRRKH